MCEKTIKPLAKFFIGRGEVRGFKFTQMIKSDKAFLYEVNTGDQLQYEVFRYKLNKRYSCISYPTSKAFGIWSWSIMDLERAIEKFNELNSFD